ncbi:MAG: hypothetical protein K6E49_02895 [Lachnospiraceae bacterium]|nr:hypothetical protein [Lachnospiraceae bacterium]
MGILRSLRSFFRRLRRRIIRLSSGPAAKIFFVLLAAAATVILTAAVIFILKNSSKRDAASDADSPEIIVVNNRGDSDEAVPGPGESPIETASAQTKTESTSDTTILSYKENAQKGYLNRCVFLGDSRTVAMVNYGFFNDDAALAQIGISHPSFASNTFINNAGKQYTLSSYLASHQAPVIYIALGVNGINDPSEEHYKSTFIDLIDKVMNASSNSNIVLMSIGPVDDNGAYKKSVQNSWINKYNDFLLETAKQKHIFYLNISEVLTGQNGQVKSEYNGGDGLHYSKSGCEEIFNYIVDHPVPGIPDDGEYVVHYIKPNPNTTKVTMDDGSGIDEEKLKELMDMMMEGAVPTPEVTVTPTPEEAQQSGEEYHDVSEEEQRAREEEEQRAREEEEQRAREEEEQREREKEEQRAQEEEEHSDEHSYEEHPSGGNPYEQWMQPGFSEGWPGHHDSDESEDE